ncbi:cationic peroxidase 2-like [Rutidosis leptorrhynchoides]|uniref:cationic peroxidase 2-like n=1 Tax=Rutidosis leptorrhynchoides TaxID=125765 RepID=UPI003A99F870
MIEKECPGVVSCADILALAARDSVVLTGGIGWAVPTGRRDGLVSLASEADKLPSSKDSVDVQIEKFANKGLDIEDLVTLVGGHTIGTSSCARFLHRLHNYDNTHKPDPKIDQAFVLHLQALCPNPHNGTARVDLDTGSVDKFDNSYYDNLSRGQGVLESDSNLWNDSRTRKLVEMFVGVGRRPRLTLSEKFGSAMVKLSNVEVKTGDEGEIRRMCSFVN